MICGFVEEVRAEEMEADVLRLKTRSISLRIIVNTDEQAPGFRHPVRRTHPKGEDQVRANSHCRPRPLLEKVLKNCC
jgi:hypothetical protein